MTITEIYNILENVKELSFDNHNWAIAVFLGKEDIETQKQLEDYIKENDFSAESWWSNRIRVNGIIYTIYESWEVEEEIDSAINTEYMRIKNTLGDKFEYFDFDRYIEDNPIPLEEVLECDVYYIVYDDNDTYYITR